MADYGTVEYYEEGLKKAQLREELMQESITARLKKEKKCKNIKLYLEILQKMQDEVEYERTWLENAKNVEKEKKKNAENEE